MRVKERYTDDELAMLVAIAHEVETGESVFEPDHGLALALYSLCAAYGDATAMNNYGWMVLNGIGVAKNIDVAIQAFEDAAVRGHALAMVNLGNIYENMNGCAEADFGEYEKIYNVIYLNRNAPVESKYTDYKKSI